VPKIQFLDRTIECPPGANLRLVLIRAPLSGTSYDARTEDALKAASCAPFLQTTDRPAASQPSG